MIGVCLFTVASALCTLASSSGLLIAARALQGLGAAVMFPASLALLAAGVRGRGARPRDRDLGAVIGLAFAAGPLVGGVLVDAIGWQAIFALGVVLGLPTIALALTKVRESQDPDPSPVDWPGVATLSLGLFLIVFAVLRGNALGWTSAPVLGLVAVGAVSLAAFVRVELRAVDPMLDLRLFRNRTFLGATVIVATLAGGSFGVFVYLSLFLLDVGGGSPVEVGLWLAPLALFAFASSLLAGRLAGRVSLTAALAVGMGLCAGGLLLMTGIDADSSWLHLLAGLSVVGVGTGLANPMVTFAHLGVLPPAPGAGSRRGSTTPRASSGWRSASPCSAWCCSRTSPIRSCSAPTRSAPCAARSPTGSPTATSPAPPSSPRGPRERACAPTYEAAFASGLNELLLISVVLALIGLTAALVLVRTRDLWQPGV